MKNSTVLLVVLLLCSLPQSSLTASDEKEGDQARIRLEYREGKLARAIAFPGGETAIEPYQKMEVPPGTFSVNLNPTKFEATLLRKSGELSKGIYNESGRFTKLGTFKAKAPIDESLASIHSLSELCDLAAHHRAWGIEVHYDDDGKCVEAALARIQEEVDLSPYLSVLQTIQAPEGVSSIVYLLRKRGVIRGYAYLKSGMVISLSVDEMTGRVHGLKEEKGPGIDALGSWAQAQPSIVANPFFSPQVVYDELTVWAVYGMAACLLVLFILVVVTSFANRKEARADHVPTIVKETTINGQTADLFDKLKPSDN